MRQRGQPGRQWRRGQVTLLRARAAHVQQAETAAALHAHRQQAGGTLLEQTALVVGGGQAVLHRRPGRADAGVAGEGQFHLRGEDADTVVGAGFRWQEEHRLGQVQPGGDGLHGGIVQAVGIEHDAQRVAGARARGEDIQLQIAACVHGYGRDGGRPA